MKKYLMISITIVAFFTMIASCDRSDSTSIKEDLNSKNITKDIASKKTQPFPDKDYIRSINYSILKFEVTEYDKKKERSWTGHCCLYCNKRNGSYLVMPLHCFPYDSTKRYRMWATDYKKRTFELSGIWNISSGRYDATIVVVGKIENIPTLCEQGLIGRETIIGDSAVLLVPFNQRSIHEKYGMIGTNNQMEMNTFFGEPGDSGGLVVGRDGVIGISSSITEKGKRMQFIPISVFEDLYGDAYN